MTAQVHLLNYLGLLNMKPLTDKDVIEYLKYRVLDGANRLATKHVDIIERRLIEEKLVEPVVAPEKAPEPESKLLQKVGMALAVLGLLLAGQLDLASLVELAISYAIN